MIRYAIQVTGKVQGVFYRQSAQEKAIDLGLKGFVQNQPDGSVYIEAQGNQAQLDELVAWCHQGSLLAKVAKVNFHEIPPVTCYTFEIKRN